MIISLFPESIRQRVEQIQEQILSLDSSGILTLVQIPTVSRTKGLYYKIRNPESCPPESLHSYRQIVHEHTTMFREMHGKISDLLYPTNVALLECLRQRSRTLSQDERIHETAFLAVARDLNPVLYTRIRLLSERLCRHQLLELFQKLDVVQDNAGFRRTHE